MQHLKCNQEQIRGDLHKETECEWVLLWGIYFCSLLFNCRRGRGDPVCESAETESRMGNGLEVHCFVCEGIPNRPWHLNILSRQASFPTWICLIVRRGIWFWNHGWLQSHNSTPSSCPQVWELRCIPPCLNVLSLSLMDLLSWPFVALQVRCRKSTEGSRMSSGVYQELKNDHL